MSKALNSKRGKPEQTRNDSRRALADEASRSRSRANPASRWHKSNKEKTEDEEIFFETQPVLDITGTRAECVYPARPLHHTS